ncbi:hypothetical protein LJR245_003866 [Rhizobium leguminosarum]|uniref:hypothetical protein n=1 Tax=Rhizobium leguminosarum TaxID=384 RepID=UPI003ECE6B46
MAKDLAVAARKVQIPGRSKADWSRKGSGLLAMHLGVADPYAWGAVCHCHLGDTEMWQGGIVKAEVVVHIAGDKVDLVIEGHPANQVFDLRRDFGRVSPVFVRDVRCHIRVPFIRWA